MLQLLQPVVGGPVDKGVPVNLDHQAREFLDLVLYRAGKHSLGRPIGDEAHDVVEPANRLWLAARGQRGIRIERRYHASYDAVHRVLKTSRKELVEGRGVPRCCIWKTTRSRLHKQENGKQLQLCGRWFI